MKRNIYWEKKLVYKELLYIKTDVTATYTIFKLMLLIWNAKQDWIQCCFYAKLTKMEFYVAYLKH